MNRALALRLSCFPKLLPALVLSVTLVPGLLPASESGKPATMAAPKPVPDLAALVERAEAERERFIGLLPPAEDFHLCQPIGTVVFDPSGFPKDFLAGLASGTERECTVYRVVLAEDPITRELVFSNAGGKPFHAVAPAAGYDPAWLVKALYPEVYSGDYSKEDIAWLEACYDPSRVSIVMTLLPASEAEAYFSAQDKEALAAPAALFDMDSLEGQSVEDLVFTDICSVSNGVRVTLAYPDDYTNRVDFFTCADLLASWWSLGLTTNVVTSTNRLVWTDTAAPALRFYVAGNADTNAVTDPDGDGLTWAREQFLHHTSPTNGDSDADGLGDYEEVINRHTDPNNGDTNAPAAWLAFPTNMMRRVWLP